MLYYVAYVQSLLQEDKNLPIELIRGVNTIPADGPVAPEPLLQTEIS